MGNLKYNYSFSFVQVTTSCCNVAFMMLSSMRDNLQESHERFYCPQCGGNQYWPQESDTEKLERRLKFEKRRRESAERGEKYQANCARAQKAAKTRIKNRIANGVCPCCNRTFKQLAAHMKRKHPDYTKEDK